MNEIDVKDEEIISQLILDARQTNSTIAKKVGVSREVVQYRIARLERKGILKKYFTLVDSAALGYITFHIYVRLQDFDEEQEYKIIDGFKQNPYLKWLVSISGQYDLFFVMVARTRYQLDKQLRDMFEPFLENISGTLILNSFGLLKQYSFMSKGREIKSSAETFENPESNYLSLKPIDIEILECLSIDARINVVDISASLKKRKIDLTPEAISYRIKKLNKERLIRGYQAVVDYSKLGYLWYVLLFNVKTLPKDVEMCIRESFLRNEKILYADKTLGSWNFRVELLVKNHEDFHSQLVNLRKLLGHYLNKYELMIIFADHVTCSFTKGMYKELINMNKKKKLPNSYSFC